MQQVSTHVAVHINHEVARTTHGHRNGVFGLVQGYRLFSAQSPPPNTAARRAETIGCRACRIDLPVQCRCPSGSLARSSFTERSDEQSVHRQRCFAQSNGRNYLWRWLFQLPTDSTRIVRVARCLDGLHVVAIKRVSPTSKHARYKGISTACSFRRIGIVASTRGDELDVDQSLAACVGC